MDGDFSIPKKKLDEASTSFVYMKRARMSAPRASCSYNDLRAFRCSLRTCRVSGDMSGED